MFRKAVFALSIPVFIQYYSIAFLVLAWESSCDCSFCSLKGWNNDGCFATYIYGEFSAFPFTYHNSHRLLLISSKSTLTTSKTTIQESRYGFPIVRQTEADSRT
ncbi:hypothetical protein GCK72_025838 [Caenorhabditis remanei]|uniref:Uncharacterized protein n=1 Tax=Caenorhabditis remanei TaxID=31234 RepID=A0A6A5G392_CAERE|nr:hypothetical protein GCK72_025838 [Caenorhabditis remanei]KAF1749370.1 hypothetical protein GCK72_025838 [Caenorhabditis remanei]